MYIQNTSPSHSASLQGYHSYFTIIELLQIYNKCEYVCSLGAQFINEGMRNKCNSITQSVFIKIEFSQTIDFSYAYDGKSPCVDVSRKTPYSQKKGFTMFNVEGKQPMSRHGGLFNIQFDMWAHWNIVFSAVSLNLELFPVKSNSFMAQVFLKSSSNFFLFNVKDIYVF